MYAAIKYEVYVIFVNNGKTVTQFHTLSYLLEANRMYR